MALDIIYLIIATPITIGVMYVAHCIKQHRKHLANLPEAKPYQFEKDEFIEGAQEFTEMLVQRRMYKGKQL